MLRSDRPSVVAGTHSQLAAGVGKQKPKQHAITKGEHGAHPTRLIRRATGSFQLRKRHRGGEERFNRSDAASWMSKV